MVHVNNVELLFSHRIYICTDVLLAIKFGYLKLWSQATCVCAIIMKTYVIIFT